MTTANTIAALYDIAKSVDGYTTDEFFAKLVREVDKYDPFLPPLVQAAGLIHELKEDLKHEMAKSLGRTSALAAIKRIIKSAPDDRPLFRGAHTENGIQYYLHQYMLIALADGYHLPLDELAPDVAFAVERYESFFKSSDEPEVELPDLTKLKAYIKLDKAAHKGERGYKPTYDFGEEYKCTINARYLADVMEIIPDAKARLHSNGYMLQLEDEHGNRAVIAMVRRKK